MHLADTFIQSDLQCIYLRFIRFPSASDCSFKLQWLSAWVALITSSFVKMSLPVWKFFSVAEEDNAIAICNACSARIPRGGKKGVKLTQQFLYLTWKVVIVAKLY